MPIKKGIPKTINYKMHLIIHHPNININHRKEKHFVLTLFNIIEQSAKTFSPESQTDF